MCKDCGCSDANRNLHGHFHHHNNPGRRIEIRRQVLESNDVIAARNRTWLDKHKITAFNLMSSPGAGKTMLLEKTLEYLKGKCEISVITGDQYTDRDQKRLQAFSLRVHQINTISACHLDASQIEKCLGPFVKESDDLLIIENIGNLVCPAAFDLGEHKKVALLSVTEGEDKPIKYPALFHGADAIVITKTDLMPHLAWNKEACISFIRQLNPNAPIFWVSALRGDGLGEWYSFLVDILLAENFSYAHLPRQNTYSVLNPGNGLPTQKKSS